MAWVSLKEAVRSWFESEPLTISEGGTGQSTARSAANELLSNLNDSNLNTSLTSGDIVFITGNTNGTSDTFYKRKLSALKPSAIGLDGAVTRKLLWTNASQNSAFSSQTISNIGLVNYDMIAIEFKNEASTDYHQKIIWNYDIAMSSLHQVFCAQVNSSNRLWIATRTFNITSTGTGIKFDNGKWGYYDDSSFIVDNDVCIPTKIYGLRSAI